MKNKLLCTLALLTGGLGSALAIDPPPVMPEVAKVIQQSIDAGEISGAVTVVGTRDGDLHYGAAGWADIEEKIMMEMNSLFWIASMTKPVTGVAVMMLAEQGKLSVDDPVAKYLPEFNDLKDADGKLATITIANCLSHTAGLQELSKDEEKSTNSLAELAEITARKPVKFPRARNGSTARPGSMSRRGWSKSFPGKSFRTFCRSICSTR